MHSLQLHASTFGLKPIGSAALAVACLVLTPGWLPLPFLGAALAQTSGASSDQRCHTDDAQDEGDQHPDIHKLQQPDTRPNCESDRVANPRERQRMERYFGDLVRKEDVVTSLRLRSGEIVDCVDLYKQPALRRRGMEAHRIELRPLGEPEEKKAVWRRSRQATRMWIRVLRLGNSRRRARNTGLREKSAPKRQSPSGAWTPRSSGISAASTTSSASTPHMWSMAQPTCISMRMPTVVATIGGRRAS
jgi:hypothetical protein